MIGGYVGTVPGGRASHMPAPLLEGTGDTGPEGYFAGGLTGGRQAGPGPMERGGPVVAGGCYRGNQPDIEIMVRRRL